MKLNESLKFHRESLQLTQDELADKLYVSRQAISKWERGETAPDIENLVRLSDIYDISVDELSQGTSYLPKPFTVGETNIKKIMVPVMIWIILMSVVLGVESIFFGIFLFIIGTFSIISFLKQGKLTVYRNTVDIDYYKDPVQAFLAFFNPKKYRYTYKYDEFDTFEIKYEVRHSIYGYPDRFTARIIVDEKLMEIVLFAKRTQEYLPCFVEFLSSKGVHVEDKENIIKLLNEGQRLYETKHGYADELDR